MTKLEKQVNLAMSGLSKSANIEDLMYRLYVLDQIEKAEVEADRGETMTSEELRQEIAAW